MIRELKDLETEIESRKPKYVSVEVLDGIMKIYSVAEVTNIKSSLKSFAKALCRIAQLRYPDLAGVDQTHTTSAIYNTLLLGINIGITLERDHELDQASNSGASPTQTQGGTSQSL
jgi:hypothetical protein